MKKLVMLSVLVVIVSSSVVFLNSYQNNISNPDSQIPNNPIFWPFSTSLKIALKRMMITNSIRPDEIGRINFALPGHADFDTSNNLSLFGEGNIALSKIRMAMEEMSPEAVEPGFLITAGNRVHGAASEETEIIAVLATNSKSTCLRAERNITGKKAQIPTINMPLNLSSPAVKVPPDEVATLPKPIGCVRAKNGLFAYHTLLER